MAERAIDLAALTRLLNALAGVAGGFAAPGVADWLEAQLPLGGLGRQAANLSGLAWAGASLTDLLAWVRDYGAAALLQQLPLSVPPAALPAADDLEGQLALWQRLAGR